MRRGMFFRLSRLEYPEIGDAAARRRRRCWRWGGSRSRFSMSTRCIGCSRRRNWWATWRCREMCVDWTSRISSRVLRAQHTEPRPFHGWCAQLNDRVFRPVVKPLAERFRLLFFGEFPSRLDCVRRVGPWDQLVREGSGAYRALSHESAYRRSIGNGCSFMSRWRTSDRTIALPH